MNFNKITRGLSKGLFFVKKNADTIEMIGGMIAVGVGTFFLIKDADKITEAKKEVKEVKETGASKTEVVKTAVTEYGKATWKGLAFTGGGLVLMGISHATVHKQLEAVSASLAATSLSFNNYRKRVVADQGEEKDYQYLTGGVATEVEVKKDGTVVTTQTPINDPKIKYNYIPHSYLFDEKNPNWQKQSWANRTFLQQNLNYLNQRLMTIGYLTENEMRQAIGANRTVAGQAAGILYENPDGTTNQLSFGMERDNPQAQAFRDGEENSFLIIFQKDDGSPIENNIYDRTGWELY